MNLQQLISLPDIARLAQVQRPVVSVWRTRSRGTQFPFPDSKQTNGSQELFASAEIVNWLQETGRGNNPEFKEDSAAYTTLARENFHVITALLALQQNIGQPLANFSPNDVLDLADNIDAEDEFLYSEVEAAREHLDFLAPFVDNLVDASYGALPAFEALFADRFRANEDSLSRTAISEPARRLVARCAWELASTARVFQESSTGGSDLLHELTQGLHEAETLRIQLPASADSQNAETRLTKRRIRMLVTSNESLAITSDPVDLLHATHLAQFPAPGAQDDDPKMILQGIDDLVLELAPQQSAVIIAPANVLVDSSQDKELANIRASILRMGRVVAAARLPRGHFLYKPRTSLALWIIGPDNSEVPLAERRIMLADLSELALDDGVIADFVSDLAASFLDVQGLRAHSFRFAQWGRTSKLIATSDGLLPRHRFSRNSMGENSTLRAKHQVEFEQSLIALNKTAPERPIFQMELQPRIPQVETEYRSGPLTIADLIAHGTLQLLSGTRFAENSLQSNSSEGIGVWSPSDLQSGSPSSVISYFDLAQSYGRSVITEPGDVIFTSIGIPAAQVDLEGSKVVNFPARILRIKPTSSPRIHPAVLASDINRQQSADWRKWEIRQVPPDTFEAMDQAFQLLDAERTITAQRIKLLDDVSQQITNALLSGGLEILVPDSFKKGRT